MDRNAFIQRVHDGDIKIKFNGHHRESREIITYSQSPLAHPLGWYDKAFFDEWVLFHLQFFSDKELVEKVPCFIGLTTCGECGKDVYQMFDGETITITTDEDDLAKPCEQFGGIKDYSVEIDVPSGCLVFANDFRQFMKKGVNHYVNHSIGILRTVQDTAKQGFLTAFVGNSCPGVYFNNNEIIVGNEGVDDNDYPEVNFGKCFGSICTDLWWFYAMDKKHHEMVNGDTCNIGIEAEVDVEPGRYQMTVHANSILDGTHYAEKYATIKRIRNVEI